MLYFSFFNYFYVKFNFRFSDCSYYRTCLIYLKLSYFRFLSICITTKGFLRGDLAIWIICYLICFYPVQTNCLAKLKILFKLLFISIIACYLFILYNTIYNIIYIIYFIQTTTISNIIYFTQSVNLLLLLSYINF